MNFVGKSLTKVFGSRNDRLLKKYRRIVDDINAAEPAARSKTDAELRARTLELRKQLVAGTVKIDDVLPEAMSIIREAMDRHIGIREVFNPEQNFDPDQFDDAMLDTYDRVQQQMIATGVDFRQVEIPVELYDAVRKLYPESRPPFRARCFDVQLIGGVVLGQGKIAEMKTGEGKTFVAPLAAFMRAIQGQHTHVVTVNDYLVKRDATWTKPAFDQLGLSVGYLQQSLMPGGQGRKQAYACDVTYGTNSEFGFDYLRDNMKEKVQLQVQGPLDYAIIDEVDSILIDEARTPLIISGEANTGAPKYGEADEVARYIMDLARPWQKAQDAIEDIKKLTKVAEGELDKVTKQGRKTVEAKIADLNQKLVAAEAKQAGTTQYYEVEMDKKSVHLTHEGIAAAQEKAGVGSFYVGDNMDWPHLMEQAMRAHVVYEKDKDYVVEPDPRTGQMGVVIVDEYTGRKMVGRQWSDGLHQACEAKERVAIKKETQTLATITLQNFFKLYKALAGMTGTAQTEAEEFSKIYDLEVVSIPTNRPVIRQDETDLVYRTEQEKYDAILDDIKANSDAGRPVLVGTTSVEKSEMLSRILQKKHAIQHEVLNAKQHEREAHIVEHAGGQHTNKQGQLVGNVTIATNMAGRGTDIKLAKGAYYEVVSREGKKVTLKQRGTDKMVTVGENDEEKRYVFQIDSGTDVVGGLHVVATERHTARRIDDQLRGRSGRQGDPGSSRFYVSLQDPLMKMFMPEWATNVLKRAGLEYGEPIESRLVTRQIAGAQKKVEERNFLSRKNLLEYDEVMDVQRLQFYGLRQKVLEGRDIDRVIWDMIGESINDAVDKYIGSDYRSSVLAEWGRNTFQTQLDPDDLAGLKRREDVDDLYRQKAKNDVRDTIHSTLGEFMGEDSSDPEGWDLRGLQSWARSRYGVEMSQDEIQKIDADELEERLCESSYEKIDRISTDDVEPYLVPLYPVQELCNWANEKFAIGLEPAELLLDVERAISRPPAEIIEIIEKRARDAYRKREIEFPVDHTLALVAPQSEVVDNEQAAHYLTQWARAKFAMDLPMSEVQGERVRTLRDRLLPAQASFLDDDTKISEAVDAIIAEGGEDQHKLAAAYAKRFGIPIDPIELDPARLSESVKGTKERDVDGDGSIDQRDILMRRGRYAIRKELTDLEQFVLINIFDQAWKDHLYAMDVLKGGIGMQAFAERDPRIAYKREGYRYFRQMMEEVRDRVTDLIFRVQVQGQRAPEPKDAYGQGTAVHAEVDENAAAFGEAEAAAQPAPTPAAAEESSPESGAKRQPKKDRNQKGKRR